MQCYKSNNVKLKQTKKKKTIFLYNLIEQQITNLIKNGGCIELPSLESNT